MLTIAGRNSSRVLLSMMLLAVAVAGCGRTAPQGTFSVVESESQCDNQRDDDLDGLTDCQDPDCQQAAECVSGTENCGNGIDDDGDGATDCEDDDCFGHRLCESSKRETCDNDQDDDGDGLVDCLDPDCLKDPTCVGGTENCGNRLDDDGDNKVDCDDEDCKDNRLCRGGGDEEICDNGKDDNANGLVDCLDPQCSGKQGCEELKENCTNSRDDDADNLVDCDDPDCIGDPACVGKSENCTNRQDDDGDRLTDCQDPDCFTHPACKPQPGEEICNNGIDDDEDNDVDCDDSECRNLPICRVPGDEICDNGIDDDGNGATDCADPVCVHNEECQDRVCRPSVSFGTLSPQGSSVTRTLVTSSAVDIYQSPCVVPGGGEVVGAFNLTGVADLRVAYDQLSGDHVLSIYHASVNEACDAHPVRCLDPKSQKTGAFSVTALPAGRYYLFAEAFSAGLEGRVKVTLQTESESQDEVCNNGVDDDGDEAIDCTDLDCALDPACTSQQCGVDVNLGTLVIDGPTKSITVNTSGGGDDVDEVCAAGGGGDRVVRVVMPASGGMAVQVRQQGWHVFGMHHDQGPGTTCTADRGSCFDSNASRQFTVAYDTVEKGVYYFVVDALDAAREGSVRLTFRAYGNRGPELCDNDVDDDGDGLTDCVDPECVGRLGCPGAVCVPDHRTGALRPGGRPVSFALDTRNAQDNNTVPCALGGGRDEVIEVEMPEVAGLRVNCADEGDHVIALFRKGAPRDPCDEEDNRRNCADPSTGPIRCNFIFPNIQPGTYYLVVEAFKAGDEGSIRLNLQALPDHAQEICNNGKDDDGDKRVDCEDSNCATDPVCEAIACTASEDLGLVQKDGPAKAASVTTEGGEDNSTTSCGAVGAPDAVVSFTLTQQSDLEINFAQLGNHVFALHKNKGPGFPCDVEPVACLPTDDRLGGTVTFSDIEPGQYYLIIDGAAPDSTGTVGIQLSAK